MNNELKIILSVYDKQAKKALNDVKKDLKGLDKESQGAGAAISKAMAAMGTAAKAALGAIAGLTTAMVGLHSASADIAKVYGKLVSSFQSVGLSSGQAAKTYKELYSFLGDTGKASEAASILSQLTQEEKNLSEWTQILKGAYATWTDSISTESLAEAINETAKVGKVVGTAADAFNWMGVSEDAVNEKLATLNSTTEREAYLRSLLNGLYGNSASLYDKNNSSLTAYNNAQADLQLTMARLNAYTTPLMTAFANLATVLLTSLAPAIATVAACLTAFIQLIAEAITWVGNFFGVFSSKSEEATGDMAGYKKAMSDYLASINKCFGSSNSSIDESIDKIKQLKKQTMGFDELNVVSKPIDTSSGVGGGAGGGGSVQLPQMPNPEDYGIELGIDTEELKKTLEDAKEQIKGLGVLVALVAGGFAAWKLATFLSHLTSAYKLVKGLKDLDIDLLYQMGQITLEEDEAITYMDKFKEKVKVVGGYMMAIAGAMLLIQGFTDAWANGVDWGNLATMIGGIALIVGGLALSVGSVGAAIELVVGSIALVVVGIKDFIENGYSAEAVISICVGAIGILVGVVWALNTAVLANPISWVAVAIVAAIMAVVAIITILWNECEGFRNFIKAAIDFIVNLFWTVVNFVKNNWQALLLMLVNPFAGAFKLIYDNCEGFRNIVDNTVKAVKGFFAKLWEDIKNIFSGVGTFFTNVFSGIVSVFKNIGKTVADTISGAVKGAINKVLSTAANIINGFISAINFAIGVINAIPGVSIKTLSKLEVPKLAKGGIVGSATLAQIGEAGKEAVLPLENNTQWMDVLADKIASRNGAPSKIVLQLDGKELGWANINSINQITKQTGELQLAII